MREQLEKKNHVIKQYLEITDEDNKGQINKRIKESLHQFANECKNPAVWCYGKHTKMLMTDFIFEIKNVKFIIDETYAGKEESGFSIISQEQIRASRIDGIIISSYKYRKEIQGIIKEKYEDVKFLDIYDVLENGGIVLSGEYYAVAHPYDHYLLINQCNRRLRSNRSQTEKKEIYIKLIKEYVRIKDFRSAILCAQEYISEYDAKFEIIDELQEIYKLQQKAMAEISDKNVLMLCVDGLRRQDLNSGYMDKIKRILDKNAFIFSNAYAVSTSTFESLIPAYSENSDLRTGYYEKNSVSENQCRFIRTAIEQGRNIYFYTDSVAFVDSEKIRVTDSAQTATEKIWNFLLDAVEEDNGLFYIHILYESHFSYPSPYTREKLVADGSNIMFDFLSRNGECLRTDYQIQHKDALTYLDDTLYLLLSELKVRYVLYADHGNIILPPNTKLGDISYTQGTFHEDLVRIPIVMKSPEMGKGKSNGIISLMSINDMIISLLKKEKYVFRGKGFVKIVRSEIYNPDFRYLYEKNAQARGLLAFEAFIFDTGYKLIVYSDGASELYETVSDAIVDDKKCKTELIDKVRDLVTVTDMLS